MKDESKKFNFRKLPKKLLSFLLALTMLVGMVQVAFTVAPVAHAAWTDTMGTLNEMLWRCSERFSQLLPENHQLVQVHFRKD